MDTFSPPVIGARSRGSVNEANGSGAPMQESEGYTGT